jgi:NAD-dependent SIR2 family protein deacetylase
MQRAVDWIHDADGLLITAGAGMGVDSGLPDLRGTEGFWRAYPALRHHGFSFEDIANPAVFVSNPRLGWGFYGHRLALYRSTVPHAGFGILLKWAARMNRGGFVFTSNVDGQFIRAGFRAANVAECHGTIHQLQCVEACTDEAWSAGNFNPIVNETTCLLENDLPRCPHCGALARPNILMFGDWKWVARYTEQQERALAAWLASVGRLVVVELGAGRALPTVRRFSERSGERVIRVNPRDHEISPTIGVGIAVSALDALQRLDDLISSEADQFRWRLAP